ncbi:hypothetical protein DITRI_Ditri04bG0055900 [Diplodiscus trichospermus]
MKVCELWLPGSKYWNVNLLHELFCEEDVKAILKLPPAMYEKEDRLIWHYEKKEGYSVRSGYRLAVKEVLELDVNKEVCSWSKIWTLKVLPRVKAFMWRLCSDFLPIRDRLNRKGIECWNEMNVLPVNINADRFVDWFEAMVQVWDEEYIERVCMVLWAVWKQRNNKLWKNQDLSLMQVVKSAMEFYNE